MTLRINKHENKKCVNYYRHKILSNTVTLLYIITKTARFNYIRRSSRRQQAININVLVLVCGQNRKGAQFLVCHPTITFLITSVEKEIQTQTADMTRKIY